MWSLTGLKFGVQSFKSRLHKNVRRINDEPSKSKVKFVQIGFEVGRVIHSNHDKGVHWVELYLFASRNAHTDRVFKGVFSEGILSGEQGKNYDALVANEIFLRVKVIYLDLLFFGTD